MSFIRHFFSQLRVGQIVLLGGLILVSSVLCGCSSAKFLSEGQQVLSSVKLTSTDSKLNVQSYRAYVRQEPNSQWFDLCKVPLGIYCMSGSDSTARLNRFLRRLGEQPVIYDSLSTQETCLALTQALQSRGYLNANASVKLQKHQHKVGVTYQLNPGTQYHIRSIHYDIDDEGIDSIIRLNESESKLTPGMPCDANVLDDERSRVTDVLHREGYYKVLKRYIYYDIDSTAGPQKLDLTFNFKGKDIAEDSLYDYNRYWIDNVQINLGDANETFRGEPIDSTIYRGICIRYFSGCRIRPSVLFSQLNIYRGGYYNDENIRTTYINLARLQILHSSSIHFEESGEGVLDCNLQLRTMPINQVSAEIEGTNTSGDLGVAASVNFTNRNLFHGSEVWSTKLKGAFEAITGLEGYNDQNFFEVSVESRLTFPRIIVPFLSHRQRINLRGTSEVTMQWDTQERPEFHRRVLTALWTYRWNKDNNRQQHKLDALGVNYVFMPWISSTFKNEYLDNDNARFAIVRYTYENLFILNSAYNFIYNSVGSMGNSIQTNAKRNAQQFHIGVESAGNLLYLLSRGLNVRKDTDGRYTLLDVAYAQYVKLDVDYARSFALDERNSIAMRGMFGVVLPYGNSSIVPYEKRYFAGGANSVRGWSVRELGPGSYQGEDGKVDFINQTGNIKLLFNLELRSFLFWKLWGALFVDAGNIWNTRDYAAQPGGQFHFDSFYKQLAASYGLGFRFNFDYFILRFDLAMKGISPHYENHREHFPLLHPSFKRDFTFHFAVGLPF